MQPLYAISDTQEEMELFRKIYHSINVFVEDDVLIYSTAPGCSERAAREANELINELGLSLVAESTNLHRKDSFTIKSI